MKVHALKLKQFRNYERLSLPIENELLFFIGDNAQGKTNLLEALYFLSTVRSFRALEEKEMMQYEKTFLQAEIAFTRKNSAQSLEIILHEAGKQLRHEASMVARVSDFVGIFNTVLFCPNDLKVMYSSPKDRRRFLDLELGKISSSYMHDVLQFQKLLKERNAYLKFEKNDALYLDTLTKRLCAVQAPMIHARDVFLQLLEKEAQKAYTALTTEDLLLHVEYQSCVEIAACEAMEEELYKRYQKNLLKDKELRTTQYGIHREDFCLYLGERELAKYGSQGQRRCGVLALKLGLIDVIFRKIKEYPILLLDDVLSELDIQKRSALFQLLPKGLQVFVTATDIPSEERLALPADACFYHIVSGQVQKEE